MIHDIASPLETSRGTNLTFEFQAGMESAVGYVALPLEDGQQQQQRQPKGSYITSFSFMLLLATLCVVAIILSTALSVYLYTGNPSRMPDTFRRPNQYINLNKIKHAHDFPPIINFPDIVLGINVNDTQRLMNEDHRTLYTNVGTIHTDDRHVHVTRERSSIIQFRHLDYGMEHCRLMALIPEYDSENRSRSLSVIDVWVLDISAEISRQTSDSWIRAPKRQRLLTSLTLGLGVDFAGLEFGCRSNEFTTFEFSCQSAKECYVDFWQDKRRRPVGGIYVIQESGSITGT